jgi:hypothetical protein
VDRAVHPAAAEQGGVRGVDDRVGRHGGYVPLDKAYGRHELNGKEAADGGQELVRAVPVD